MSCQPPLRRPDVRSPRARPGVATTCAGPGVAPGLVRSRGGQRAGGLLRPEVRLQEVPGPQRLAPYSFAMTADLAGDGATAAEGRWVVSVSYTHLRAHE